MSDEVEQLKSMVQSHHGKIYEIEKILGKTPDPATLRGMEHVYKELPHTDDLKGVVDAHKGRTAIFRRVTMSVVGGVALVAMFAILGAIWQGIQISILGASK